METKNASRLPDDIAAWRSAERAARASRRADAPAAERDDWDRRIERHLLAGFAMPAEAIVGFCWPWRAEFDARAVIRSWCERGASAALPEIVARHAPLRFSAWSPQSTLRDGLYGIPVPDGTTVVVPDVLLVPMNAFDEKGFRLGYGGGYFDATLAALERRVVAIGVAYELGRVATIHPQVHDMAMDFVVTERGLHAAGGGAFVEVDAAESRKCFSALLTARCLPRATCGAEYSSPVCYAAEFPGYFDDAGARGRTD